MSSLSVDERTFQKYAKKIRQVLKLEQKTHPTTDELSKIASKDVLLQELRILASQLPADSGVVGASADMFDLLRNHFCLTVDDLPVATRLPRDGDVAKEMLLRLDKLFSNVNWWRHLLEYEFPEDRLLAKIAELKNRDETELALAHRGRWNWAGTNPYEKCPIMQASEGCDCNICDNRVSSNEDDIAHLTRQLHEMRLSSQHKQESDVSKDAWTFLGASSAAPVEQLYAPMRVITLIQHNHVIEGRSLSGNKIFSIRGVESCSPPGDLQCRVAAALGALPESLAFFENGYPIGMQDMVPDINLITVQQDIKGLMLADWSNVCSTKGFQDFDPITKVKKVLYVGVKHGQAHGKWMVFLQPQNWTAFLPLLHACIDRGDFHEAWVMVNPGCHGVQLWTDDFTDYWTIMNVGKCLSSVLWSAGVHATLTYKPDVYSFLGIYRNNTWRIPPSLHQLWT